MRDVVAFRASGPWLVYSRLTGTVVSAQSGRIQAVNVADGRHGAAVNVRSCAAARDGGEAPQIGEAFQEFAITPASCAPGAP
jgi:hypothetical protein